MVGLFVECKSTPENSYLFKVRWKTVSHWSPSVSVPHFFVEERSTLRGARGRNVGWRGFWLASSATQLQSERKRAHFHRYCCDVWQVYFTSWLVMSYSLLTGGMCFWKALSLYFKVFAMNKWAQHKWTYVSSGGATWLLDLFSCSCISVTVFTHLVWSEIHSNTLLVAGTVQQVCVCGAEFHVLFTLPLPYAVICRPLRCWQLSRFTSRRSSVFYCFLILISLICCEWLVK